VYLSAVLSTSGRVSYTSRNPTSLRLKVPKSFGNQASPFEAETETTRSQSSFPKLAIFEVKVQNFAIDWPADREQFDLIKKVKEINRTNKKKL
jgi:hypothetical protein